MGDPEEGTTVTTVPLGLTITSTVEVIKAADVKTESEDSS